METEWIRVAAEHWPTFTLVAVFAMLLLWFVRFLALTFESVGKALGPIGQFFRTRRTISRAESNDMRDRLLYLDGQVRALRYRDECYFAYTLYIQEWLRRQRIWAVDLGLALEPVLSFLDYRDKWMRDRGIEKEIELWK